MRVSRLTSHSKLRQRSVTELRVVIGWELNQIKRAEMWPFLSLGLSLHVKPQQQNKSQTHGMTSSRLWHPSDPKHVLVISPWLPVGVDVIGTHEPTGRDRRDQGDTGLGASESSDKTPRLERG